MFEIHRFNIKPKKFGNEDYVSKVRLSKHGHLILGKKSGGIEIYHFSLNQNHFEKIHEICDAHSDEIVNIEISPKESYFISTASNLTVVGDNHDIKQWSLLDYNNINTIQNAHEKEITQIAIHGDETYFISASYDSTIKIWSKDCQLLTKIRLAKIYFAQTYFNDSATFMKFCGNNLVIIGTECGYINIWKYYGDKSFKKLSQLKEKNNKILYAIKHEFCLSPEIMDVSTDCKTIITGEYCEIKKIYQNSFQKKSLHQNEHYMSQFVIFDNNKYLLSSSFDKSVKLWDLNNLKLKQIISLSDKAHSFALSNDDKYLVISCGNQIITYILEDIDMYQDTSIEMRSRSKTLDTQKHLQHDFLLDP